MTRPLFPRTLLLGVLFVSSGFADADVVQCSSETGAVTYTDVPCDKGMDTVRSSGPKGFIITIRNAPPASASVEASAPRGVPSMKKVAANSPSRDAMTLQGARNSVQLQDQASLQLRQEKLAALELKHQQGWFSF
jgi:hypothetical protein